MSAALVVGLTLVAVLPILVAALTAADTALGAQSVVRADAMAEEGVPGAQRLAGLMRQLDQVRASILLLRLMLQIVSVAALAVLMLDRAGIGWLAASLAIYVVVLYVLAEVVPRRWALRDPDEAARRIAAVALFVYRLAPLRWLSKLVTAGAGVPSAATSQTSVMSEDELIALAEEAAAGDEIEDEEREMIESVFALGDTVVREVMVPRTDMTTVSSGTSISDVLDLALELGLSRLPVCGGDIDDIVGVSFVKDLTRAERSQKGGELVTSLMRRARFVPETKHAHNLLREMQDGQHHMAIVVDEYGGTAGLVTLEDLIEELVGEIVDEFDSEEPIWETLASGDVRVHGRMPVDQLNSLVDADLPEGDWDTVGGLIFDSLGRVPEIGESVEVGGLRLVIELMEGRRITRVRLTPPESDPPSLNDA